MRPHNQHLYAFGPFRLDARERMLLRGRQYIPLTPKALETLMVLVEHGGRVVEKEELLRQVWPDTFVEDVTVAKNISTLRKTLGETEEHRYIETIPKRGYRFVADLQVLDREETPEAPHQDGGGVAIAIPTHAELELPSANSEPRFARLVWLAGLLVVLAGAGLIWWRALSSHRPGPAILSGKTVPLTSFAGSQNQVAFSLGGNQIAFVQDSSNDDSRHIFVKLLS